LPSEINVIVLYKIHNQILKKQHSDFQVQCLALWQLRSTLEDEGTDSDITRTGATSEEHSPG